MTKRELVIDVAERLGYTQNEVSEVVQAALETITEALAEGNRLEIRNFGVFEIKVRDARIGRNPRTGDSVPISEKRVAVFKPGKALKELVEKGDFSASASSSTPAAQEAPPQEPSESAASSAF